MSAMTVFDYQGNDISFDFGNNYKMINATQMAKPFGKRPSKFLELPSTKRFIGVLDRRSDVQKSVITIRGNFSNNKPQGTWMHEKLALKFAAWLSPDFELWVYDRIQELLLTGSTSIQQRPKTTAEIILQQAEFMVAMERRQIQLQQEQEVLQEKVKDLEIKTATRPNYFTVIGYSMYIGRKVSLQESQKIGRAASRYCKLNGLTIDKVTDQRYGRVNSYPEEALQLAFEKLF